MNVYFFGVLQYKDGRVFLAKKSNEHNEEYGKNVLQYFIHNNAIKNFNEIFKSDAHNLTLLMGTYFSVAII